MHIKIYGKYTTTTSSSSASVFVWGPPRLQSSLCRVNSGNAAGWRESPKLPPCTSALTKRRRSPVMFWSYSSVVSDWQNFDVATLKIFQVFMLEIPGTFGVSSVKSSKTPPKSVSTAWSSITHTVHNPQKTTSPPNLSSLLPRHPKAFLCRGFPHVAQLTLPWTRIIGPDIGAQTPHTTQLLRDFLAQEPEGLQEIQMDFLRIWGNLKTLLHLTTSSLFFAEKKTTKTVEISVASDFCTASFNGR